MANVKEKTLSDEDSYGRKLHRSPKYSDESSCRSQRVDPRPPEARYLSMLQRKVEALKQSLAHPKIPSARLDDFEVLGFLGEGGYGQVWQVQHKREMDFYALKVQSKERIMRSKNQLRRLINEKNIHGVLDHAFIVKLYFSFKDNACVYFGLEYISCGNLFQAKIRNRGFDEEKTRFFVSQVVLALEYLHQCDVIYRDLKPENLLMNTKGFMKVADFGFAKHVTGVTYTFCGTDEYIAPEVLTKRGYSKGPDWWAVGVLTYELIYRFSPFFSENNERVYYRIKNDRVVFPRYAKLSSAGQDIIRRLLAKDTSERLGLLVEGPKEVRYHEWFEAVDWLALYKQRCPVPFLPKPFAATYADMDKWPRSKKALYEKEFEKF